MTIDKLSRTLGSRKLVWALIVLIVLGVLAASFELGLMIGFHKAAFASHWGENYERNFGSARGGFERFNQRVSNPHGAAGSIVSVIPPTFTIVGDFEDEKIIRISTSTTIRKQNETITMNELKTGEKAVVIGVPNEQGEIEAMLVRILPKPLGH